MPYCGKRESDRPCESCGSGLVSRIVCIDEVDHLLTKERTIVYDLLEWPYLSRHVLIVIGIANSVDLVEKSLPLLKISPRRGGKGVRRRTEASHHCISVLHSLQLQGHHSSAL